MFLLSSVLLCSGMSSDWLRKITWLWNGTKAHIEDAWRRIYILCLWLTIRVPLNESTEGSWSSQWTYKWCPAPIRRNSQLEAENVDQNEQDPLFLLQVSSNRNVSLLIVMDVQPNTLFMWTVLCCKRGKTAFQKCNIWLFYTVDFPKSVLVYLSQRNLM